MLRDEVGQTVSTISAKVLVVCAMYQSTTLPEIFWRSRTPLQLYSRTPSTFLELTLNPRLDGSKILPLDEHQTVLIQTNCISFPYTTIGLV